MNRKKILNYSCSFSISLIILVNYAPCINQTAKAFFEDQLKYKFVHYWYPMLSDSNPEKRFLAANAFLTYPQWSLPILRNAIKSQNPKNLSWQIAMLIGMLGNSKDVPTLLKIWKKIETYETAPIWLGAMQRLYWKNRSHTQSNPILKRIDLNFSENSDQSEMVEKAVNLLFEIKNKAKTPLFIKVTANFWLTTTEENIPSKYLWISAGGHIKSSFRTKIYPVSHSEEIRLDFRIWEVGVPKPIIHQTKNIHFPFF